MPTRAVGFFLLPSFFCSRPNLGLKKSVHKIDNVHMSQKQQKSPMQKLLFSTLVFLVWTGAALSQIAPFPENDAVWKEEHITIVGPIFQHFALCGDTLINGKTYSQVVTLQEDSTGTVTGKSYLSAVRVEGEQVWVFPQGFSDEILLYDFSLEANDQILLLDFFSGSQLTRTVDSVKVENLAGADRRVIYFKPDLPGESGEFWIEGFGSNYGVLWRAYLPGADIGFQLLCFQHGDEYLNLTLIECFLPDVPDCGTTYAGEGAGAKGILKLTATPNPSGSEVKFFINQKNGWENSSLKIYAANGKLLMTMENVAPEMSLPETASLNPGFYIAVLESNHRERVLAYCTFVRQ